MTTGTGQPMALADSKNQGTYREQGTVDRKLMLSLNALNRECFWDIEIGGRFHHGDTERTGQARQGNIPRGQS